MLHLLNTWLVFRLAIALGGSRIAGAITALLFGIHPAHVESVAWIAERKDVLYAAFYLGACISYLRYRATGTKKHYLICLLLFLCSLFSKSAAVTLPLVLLAIDYYKGYGITGKTLIEKVPMLLLSVLFGILAIESQKYGGAIQDLNTHYSTLNRIAVFFAGFSSYFLLLVAPFGLTAIHYFPNEVGGMLEWYYYLGVPASAVIIWLFVRQGAARRERIFALLFFLAAICVMLQVLTVGLALFSERYTYLAYTGILFVAAQWAAAQLEGSRRTTILAAGGTVLLAFSVIGWNRIGTWADADSVFNDIADKNAGKQRLSLMYSYWGNIKIGEGDRASALNYFNTAIGLDSTFDIAFSARAALEKDNHQLPAALADYNRAIALKPNKATNYNLRGWTYFQIGDTAAAIRDYYKALEVDPKFSEASNNLGWAYLQQGHDSLAIACFDRASASDPKSLKPRFNRAAVYINAGKPDKALREYNEIIRLAPTDSIAWYNRGIVRLQNKDTAGAIADWQQSAQLGNAGARRALGAFQHRQ